MHEITIFHVRKQIQSKINQTNQKFNQDNEALKRQFMSSNDGLQEVGKNYLVRIFMLFIYFALFSHFNTLFIILSSFIQH